MVHDNIKLSSTKEAIGRVTSVTGSFCGGRGWCRLLDFQPCELGSNPQPVHLFLYQNHRLRSSATSVAFDFVRSRYDPVRVITPSHLLFTPPRQSSIEEEALNPRGRKLRDAEAFVGHAARIADIFMMFEFVVSLGKP